MNVGVVAHSKVELAIECKSLPNLDVTSKSDPCVILHVKDKSGQWRVFGRTERIKDNLSPKFQKTFEIDYFFEELQLLKFEIIDVDSKGSDDLIGHVETTLGDIIGGKGSKLIANIKNPKRTHNGILIVNAEEKNTVNESNVSFTISGTALDKKDMFGKSDPYLEISRSREDGTWTMFHKTEVIKQTLNPTWMPFTLSSSKVNGGDMDRTLRFQCFDWDKHGSPDFIGEFFASVNDLRKTKDWQLVNIKKKKKKGYNNSGIIHINLDVRRIPTFLEYIAGGLEISLMVAIDYTASNGSPSSPTSLHVMNPSFPNEYQQVIQAVGNILMAYDTDKFVPVYGFGAKLKSGLVSHCFPLTGNDNAPQVFGVPGVLQLYANSFYHIIDSLSGPTNFGSVIGKAAQVAQTFRAEGNKAYLILLILTDGEISDFAATVNQICVSSGLPMSIVIVGVGSADFSKMDALDGDDVQLVATNGTKAVRDIVQFVPFRNYKNSVDRLAAETLAEIPGQVVQYLLANNVLPRPPPTQAEIDAFYQARLLQTQQTAVATGIPQPVITPNPVAPVSN